MSEGLEANSAENAEVRERATAWLSGTTRRDLAASKDTADRLARDVRFLLAELAAGERLYDQQRRLKVAAYEQRDGLLDAVERLNEIISANELRIYELSERAETWERRARLMRESVGSLFAAASDYRRQVLPTYQPDGDEAEAAIGLDYELAASLHSLKITEGMLRP